MGDGRSWDTGVRGLGGTVIVPTCSVGEENVLRRPHGEDRFALQSILVHEFAHTVMEVGLGGGAGGAERGWGNVGWMRVAWKEE